MKKILQDLEDYMVLKNFSKSTQKSYLCVVKNFYLWCESQKGNTNFEKENAHRQYLVYWHKKRLAWQTVNGDYSAIRMLYTKILGREWDEKKLPRPRKERSLPLVIPLAPPLQGGVQHSPRLCLLLQKKIAHSTWSRLFYFSIQNIIFPQKANYE